MRGGLLHRLGQLQYPLLERFTATAWNNVPRPASVRSVTRASGHDPYRVLLAGGSSAVGWGVVSHDLALAGYLARATAALTGRGLDLEVLARPNLRIPEIAAFLAPETIARFDALVFTLGGRESFEFMPVELWTTQLTTLLAAIDDAPTGATPAVVIVGAEETPPVPVPRWVGRIAMSRARAYHQTTRELIADRPRHAFVDSGMIPTAHEIRGVLDVDSAVLYDRAARAIAPTLAGLLSDAPSRPRTPVDEDARRGALDRIEAGAWREEPRLRTLLTTLRDVLHVRSADLFLVDEHEVRVIAATSLSVERSPRENSLSSETLEHLGGLVIPDLAADPAHRDRPAVVGPPHIRFYAGYPVEAPDGERIGVLTVVDTRPHEFRGAELAILRGFAARVGELLFEVR